MHVRTRWAFPVLFLLAIGCDGERAPRDAGDTRDTGTPGVDAGPSDAGGTCVVTGDTSGVYTVELATTAGPVVLEVHPEWAPNGAARFAELIEARFYEGATFFRVVPDFVVQFGISGDPSVNATWRSSTITDDPVVESNTRGMVTFAQTAAPNSRTTQLFVNYGDNSFLDSMGFAPFARVTSGMENVDAINAEYGELPDQSRIQAEGDAYLDAQFPNLDRITAACLH